MSELISIGTVSSRGQIAIPSSMRKELELRDGQKILFLVDNGTLLIKKVTKKTFAELTKPLRSSRKKIKESQVNELVHKMRQR